MSGPSKTTRLTKQHWLNIIIISVSAMLLISVLVGRMLDNNAPEENDKKQKVNIVQIDFPETQFTLVDSIWLSSDANFKHEQIVKMVKRWKALLLQQGIPISKKAILGKTILIYLESVAQPIVAKLTLNKNNLQISFTSAKQEFYLEPSAYSIYYPSITELN